MSEAKYSHGPWVYDHAKEPMHNQIVIGLAVKDSEGCGDIDPVCVVPLPAGWLAEARNLAYARARLIAAAPELLGACKSALRALEDNLRPGPMDEDAKTALRLVIAKATQP